MGNAESSASSPESSPAAEDKTLSLCDSPPVCAVASPPAANCTNHRCADGQSAGAGSSAEESATESLFGGKREREQPVDGNIFQACTPDSDADANTGSGRQEKRARVEEEMMKKLSGSEQPVDLSCALQAEEGMQNTEQVAHESPTKASSPNLEPEGKEAIKGVNLLDSHEISVQNCKDAGSASSTQQELSAPLAVDGSKSVNADTSDLLLESPARSSAGLRPLDSDAQETGAETCLLASRAPTPTTSGMQRNQASIMEEPSPNSAHSEDDFPLRLSLSLRRQLCLDPPTSLLRSAVACSPTVYDALGRIVVEDGLIRMRVLNFSTGMGPGLRDESQSCDSPRKQVVNSVTASHARGDLSYRHASKPTKWERRLVRMVSD